MRTTTSRGPGAAPPADDRVLCVSPDPTKQGTRIPRWKYDTVRAAIRKAVGRGHTGVEFRQLPLLVEGLLSDDHRARLGSVMWHVTTVKLHMEALGELERLPGVTPQRVRLATPPRQPA